jgi:hypothetical protein
VTTLFDQQTVFQMRTDGLASAPLGWLLADENVEPEDNVVFTFTIPWPPENARSRENAYLFPGKAGSDLALFALFRRDDQMEYRQGGRVVRFRLADDSAAAPYVGSTGSTLERYGWSGKQKFIPIIPENLSQMDDLYLEERVVFVGVTSRFGPHVQAQANAWASARVYGARSEANERGRPAPPFSRRIAGWKIPHASAPNRMISATVNAQDARAAFGTISLAGNAVLTRAELIEVVEQIESRIGLDYDEPLDSYSTADLRVLLTRNLNDLYRRYPSTLLTMVSIIDATVSASLARL